MAIPDLIGRYQLDRRLGSGGFAVVWLAHDRSLDTPIAIKVMAENWADRMDLRERFLTEARMLRRAASNRVVQVFDIGELPDGRPYFVMEYADRGTLADRREAGRLPLVEALRLTAEVARGVAELHAAGIVHRDVKPSNVLIRSTPDGRERLLVADLGVAKNLAQASGLTMSVGSDGYRAPEQAEPNLGVDVRADVYSLGALGYHLLTGETPAAPGRVLSDRPLPDLPQPVRRLLARTLEVDRERRWPDAAGLAVALDRLADDFSRPPARRRRPGRRTITSLAVIAAVSVLAVAGIGLVEARKPVRVQDGAGRITIDVPRRWSRELLPSGWDPGVLALSGGHQPGLLVSSDIAGWRDLDRDVAGVFVGLSDDPGLPAAVGRIDHPGCRALAARTFSDPRWSGRIRRWDHCHGQNGTLEEINLLGRGSGPEQVYVQVRQVSGRDHTDQVLASLRVAG